MLNAVSDIVTKGFSDGYPVEKLPPAAPSVSGPAAESYFTPAVLNGPAELGGSVDQRPSADPGGPQNSGDLRNGQWRNQDLAYPSDRSPLAFSFLLGCYLVVYAQV